jgi:ankyrin repeat protein
MHAAKNNANPDVVTALVNAGADVNALTYHDYTALRCAMEFNANPDVVTALLNAGAVPELL